MNRSSPMQTLPAPWTAAEGTALQAPSGHAGDRATLVLTPAWQHWKKWRHCGGAKQNISNRKTTANSPKAWKWGISKKVLCQRSSEVNLKSRLNGTAIKIQQNLRQTCGQSTSMLMSQMPSLPSQLLRYDSNSPSPLDIQSIVTCSSVLHVVK